MKQHFSDLQPTEPTFRSLPYPASFPPGNGLCAQLDASGERMQTRCRIKHYGGIWRSLGASSAKWGAREGLPA